MRARLRHRRKAVGCEAKQGRETYADGEASVRMTQRIVAGFFAAFMWLVAFSSMVSVNHDQQWLGLTSLVIGMALVLWALNPDNPV